MIELAHDFAFLGPLIDLRVLVLPSLVSSSSVFVGEGKGDSTGTVKAESDALERVKTEGSLRFVSKRKKLRRLAGTVLALGCDMAVGEMADDGRRKLDASFPNKRWLSKIAPAVLGRDSSSTVLSVGRPFRLEEVPALMTEDKLFVAEWPRTVEVSVSEDIVERGRMYSTLSENPTRAREGGRGVSSESCR